MGAGLLLLLSTRVRWSHNITLAGAVLVMIGLGVALVSPFTAIWSLDKLSNLPLLDSWF